MRKIVDGLYIHRGHAIFRDEQGIWVENSLHLFKTFTVAKEWINKTMDSTNKKEPVIVGEWKVNG